MNMDESSFAAETAQHAGFNVSAGDDRHIHLRVGHLIAVKEESGGGDGAAGLGYGGGIGRQQFHRLADFVFGDGDDVVNIGADVLEVDLADTLGAQAVGDGARDLLGRELDDFSGVEAGLGVGGQFRLDADHVNFRICQLDRRGDAADQASAANGAKDGFDVGQVFENFEADCALTGDDFFVVVGRDDDVAVLGGEFLGFGLAFLAAGADENDFRTEFGGGLALDDWGVVRHDDDSLDS